MSRNNLVLALAADDGSLEAVRAQPWGDLWVIPWGELCKRHLMESAIADDVWIIPQAWASAGTQRRLGARSVDFCKALPSGWSRSDQRSEEVLRRLKRMALAALVMPLRPVNSRYQGLKPPLKPSTWALHMRSLLLLVRQTLEACPPTEASSSTCPERFAIFQHVPPAILLAQLEAAPHARRTIVPRFNSFFEHGVFDDWPANDVDSGKRWQGEAFRPFTDEFLSELGQLACWMADEFAPLAICVFHVIAGTDSTGRRA